MNVFELHFNPQAKKQTFFETFYYEPESAIETRLGSLFIAGELVKAKKGNENFLKNLARVVKSRFYRSGNYTSPTALKYSLKEANSYLENIMAKGHTEWLTHLNLAIVAITPYHSQSVEEGPKKYKFNFTKVGTGEIILARRGQVINLTEKFENEIEPYPLRVFTNIVAGRLYQNDKLLILSQDVYQVFKEKGIGQKLAYSSALSEEKVSHLLKGLAKELSGICLLIDLNPPEKKEGKMVFRQEIFKKRVEQLSASALFFLTKAKSGFSLLKNSFGGFIGKKIAPSKIRIPSFSFNLPDFKKIAPFIKKRSSVVYIPVKGHDNPAQEKEPLQKNFYQNFSSCFSSFKQTLLSAYSQTLAFAKSKKFLWIVGLLALFLLAGIVGESEKKRKLTRAEADFALLQEDITRAETLMASGEKEAAEELLLESWQKIQPFLKRPFSFEGEIAVVKEKIEKHLFSFYNLETLENPEIYFVFNENQTLAQKIIFDGQNILAYTPLNKELVIINPNKEKKVIASPLPLSNGFSFFGETSFFAKPNKIYFLNQDRLENPFELKKITEDQGFNFFTSFNGNLYCWSPAQSQIVRYPYVGFKSWDLPQLWLKEKIHLKTGEEIKSMAIDGGIWIVRGNNFLEYYLGGQWQKTVEVKNFPTAENLKKIWTSPNFPYIYAIEPEQKRFLIIAKTDGSIIKQYQSPAFDSLKDFAVGTNGQSVYLLNADKIFRLDLRF